MHKKKYKNLINEIISKNWKHKNKILYLSVLLTFLIIAYYILRSGFVMSSDSMRFSRWADILISLDFNLYEFFLIEKANHRPPLFFFSLPVLLIALSKVIFSSEWQFSFLILNIFLVFFSLIIFVKCLLLIKVRSILISVTLPVIALSVDILTWPKFILSDMIYSFLVLYAVYFIIKSIVHNNINYLEFFAIIFLLIVSRPSSIPVVIAILLFIIILRFKILSNQKKILFFISIIFVSTPFILGSVYSFMELNLNHIAKVNFLIGMVNDGMIIHDRPETWVNKPNSFIDVVYIYFLRIINFFNPYAATFSMIHIALNTLQTLLILFSISVWIICGGYSKLENKIFFFIIILSFFIAAFHSFILIDYDWRYRFPILLPLIILFPVSLENIFRKNNH